MTIVYDSNAPICRNYFVIVACLVGKVGLVRSAAATVGEDETNLDLIDVSLPIYRALKNGFLRGCGEFLTTRERDLLPFAGRLMAYEQAIRFLTDFLLGDQYYKTEDMGHNLNRARNQLRLMERLEAL